MNKQKIGNSINSHFHLMYLITGILDSHRCETELFEDIWTGYYQIENIDDLSALQEIMDVLTHHEKTMAQTLNFESIEIVKDFIADLKERIDYLKTLLINIL